MNRFLGKITEIKNESILHQVKVDCSDCIIRCVTLDLNKDFIIGADVFVVFKETEVSLSKNFDGIISISNQFDVQVIEIEIGKILANIKLKSNISEFNSVITAESAMMLNIKPGDNLKAHIKSNEISLQGKES